MPNSAWATMREIPEYLRQIGDDVFVDGETLEDRLKSTGVFDPEDALRAHRQQKDQQDEMGGFLEVGAEVAGAQHRRLVELDDAIVGFIRPAENGDAVNVL